MIDHETFAGWLETDLNNLIASLPTPADDYEYGRLAGLAEAAEMLGTLLGRVDQISKAITDGQ